MMLEPRISLPRLKHVKKKDAWAFGWATITSGKIEANVRHWQHGTHCISVYRRAVFASDSRVLGINAQNQWTINWSNNRDFENEFPSKR